MMDGGYEISSASDDESMRKLSLLLAPAIRLSRKPTNSSKSPYRERKGGEKIVDRKLPYSLNSWA